MLCQVRDIVVNELQTLNSESISAPYCKQLYLDVTNTNNGKITWNYIKPIIQGKFLYGPTNERTNQFVRNVSFSEKFTFNNNNNHIIDKLHVLLNSR